MDVFNTASNFKNLSTNWRTLDGVISSDDFPSKVMWAINSASHNDRFVETINPITDYTFCKMLYRLSLSLLPFHYCIWRHDF